MTCPNCGQEFDGGRCPNCGRPISNAGRRIAAVLILVIFAVPFSCAGACFAIVGVSSLGSLSHMPWTSVVESIGGIALILGIGIGGFYLFQRLWWET